MDPQLREQVALLGRDALPDQVLRRDDRVDLGDAGPRDGGRADGRVGVGRLALGERAGQRLLGGIGDRDRDRVDATVVREMDRAEVGQRRHDRVHQLREQA